MGESEKFLNDYVKSLLEEVLEKDYPELGEFKEFKNVISKQKEVNSKLENKIKELDIKLNDRKYSNDIIISNRCSGNHRSRSFEVYESVLDEFIEFTKGRKETVKELVSQALLDMITKYKEN